MYNRTLEQATEYEAVLRLGSNRTTTSLDEVVMNPDIAFTCGTGESHPDHAREAP